MQLGIMGQREQGQDVRTQNILAVLSLSNIVKTSLGPQGLDKMLVDDIGDVTITNDGATILKQLEVTHPVPECWLNFLKSKIEKLVMVQLQLLSLQLNFLREVTSSLRTTFMPPQSWLVSDLHLKNL